MEISAIQKAKAVGKLQKQEGVQPPAKVEDRLSISSESAKRAEWVKMLHEMPDVRPEKLATALQASPTSLELAEKVLNSDT